MASIVKTLTSLMGVIGTFAVILNIMLVCRIMYRYFKKQIHVSMLHFVSFALSDAIFGTTALFYSLFVTHTLTLSNYRQYHYMGQWFHTMNRLYSISTILHILMVTANDFTANKFPSFHIQKVKWFRVLANIAFVWLSTLLIMATHLWLGHDFINWFIKAGEIVASIAIVLMYGNIVKAKINHNGSTEDVDISSQTDADIGRLMVNTILSFCFCFVFIMFHLPHAITTMITWNWIAYLGNYTLFTASTAINPLIYAGVEYIEHTQLSKRRYVQKRNETQVASFSNPSYERGVKDNGISEFSTIGFEFEDDEILVSSQQSTA